MQRAGDLVGHATRTANEREEDEEDENTAGNREQLTRNLVGGCHGWENENGADVVPTNAGDSRGHGRKTNKKGEYVAS